MLERMEMTCMGWTGLGLALGMAAVSLLACSSHFSAASPSSDAGASDAPTTDAIDTPVGTQADGFHRIAVAQPDGTRDDVWIYAKSPPGDGSLPVAVYGRGKGIGDVANCAPQGGA